MIKLYEITDQYAALAGFEIDTDEDMAAFSQLAKELDATFEDKAENICKLIRNFEGEAEAFKAEKARLAKRQAALEGKADALKAYLEYNMKQIAETGEKRQAGTFTLVLQKNPESVHIYDEQLIPNQFMKSAPNVAVIKDALKSGRDVNGASLVSTVSLRIK